jgi:hypothetical protein|tara:strand:- start:691 stop:882 length:192 start_codon:yes stop_codon:yes gene_type:complete
MDDIHLAELIYRAIRNKKEHITEITMQGVEDFPKYKYMVGQLHSLEAIERDIRDILKREDESE